MIDQPTKTAGEVAVNAMDAISVFQQKSVDILRHADRLYNENDFSGLPESIHRLFYKQSSSCLLYTSPSPRDKRQSRMPSSA